LDHITFKRAMCQYVQIGDKFKRQTAN